ncbi:MAG: P-II family nitrogen regulator [Alphaproteobacteria bacterium]
MHLLMMVINDEDTVQNVLAALMEVGITTATVVESQGMGKIVTEQMPIFAGFRNLWGGANPYNTTVFTVLEDDILQETIDLVSEVMFEIVDTPRGVIFTIPVDNFRHARQND